MAALPFRSSTSEPKRASLGLLVAFYVATGLAVAFAYNTWKRQSFPIDDAFISFHYARNLVDGHGLVFNVGEHVEGYTNFFWVLLAAASIALGFDPYAFCVGLGVASFLACIVLCGAVAFFSGARRLSLAAPASVALAFFVLPHGFAAMSGTGLETSFLAFVLLIMGIQNHLWRPRHVALKVVAALWPLIAVLTRPDAALVVGASGLVYLVQERIERGGWKAALWAALLRFGFAALGIGVFLLWKHSFYGSIVPNTYWAKGADFVPLEVGVRYIVAFLRHSAWVVLLIPVAIWGALRAPGVRQKAFCSFAILALGLHAAYVVKVGGDFMQYRFMWEVIPLFIALAILGLRALPSRVFAWICVAIAVPLATLETQLEFVHEMHTPQMMREYTEHGMLVGRALAELPEDTVLATTLAGTISYYSGLTVIDEWGLNDEVVAHLPKSQFGGRGHVKRAPMEYLRQRGVNLYLGHPQLCPCDQLCVENVPNVFFPVGNGQCARTWYLGPTPKLTELFCRPDSDVILDGVVCPGEVAPRKAPRPPPGRTVPPIVLPKAR